MANGRRIYPFHLIEPKWQRFWDREETFRAFNPGEVVPAGHPFGIRHGLENKTVSEENLPPKLYILDMFPYPSGAGLHVGHPEGYTATDILARYFRSKGYHVLHPMGWDAFGLPAEQYAVKTGQHPRVSTEKNIANFRRQIKSLGFSYDWRREIDTTDPSYYKWTQWIFLQIYNSYFDPYWKKATPIALLQDALSETPTMKEKWNGNPFLCEMHRLWTKQTPPEKRTDSYMRHLIDKYRLAYVSEQPVWWCEALGTVLANEEVSEGKSIIGGHPVVRKPMRQWMLRITAYAERLLEDLDLIDWSESLKEMQRNWIGRSEGAEVDFKLTHLPEKVQVFTTRPDTLFGATYMVLAPEHFLVDEFLAIADGKYVVDQHIESAVVEVVDSDTGQCEVLPTDAAIQKARHAGLNLIAYNISVTPPKCVIMKLEEFEKFVSALRESAHQIRKYREEVARKSDLERTDLAKEKTGVFTGAYAINPVNGVKLPIWIADYVLISYGTGAIMAVPAHDTRDLEFATKYNLPIIQVVQPLDPSTDWRGYTGDGIAVNSSNDEISINGLPTPEAKKKIVEWLESKGFGKRAVNYRLRDWLFSRQRYWGEPFPIIWKRDKDGTWYHEALPETALPVIPPELTDFKPTADGKPPLARAVDWVNLPDGSQRETNTMPQWAGSCWYYLRYLDPQNPNRFVDTNVEKYWMGAKFVSRYGKAYASEKVTGVEKPGVDLYVGGAEHAVLHLLYARFWHKVLYDLGYVSTPEPFFKLVNQGLILGEDGQKMSKSRGNVVNPDTVIQQYGADAFRMYEMFMGPLQDTKPWSTKGVEGIYRFLGRIWRMFVDPKSVTEFNHAETLNPNDQSLLGIIRLSPEIQDVSPTQAQLKALHRCIKKVTEDIESLKFNTAISALMVFVNEAINWSPKPASVMRVFLQLLAPFAPHIAEELWEKLHQAIWGKAAPSLTYEPWPQHDERYIVEEMIEIPVQINGKLRDVITVPSDISEEQLIQTALKSAKVAQNLSGKQVKRTIVVPKKLVNIVVQ